MLEWQSGFLPQIANRLRNGLDVRDRTYRLKTYESCIVASEAVDFMVEQDIAESRQEAVRLGRLLQKKLGFWRHVCGDHKFKDEYLFFRFSEKGRLHSNVASRLRGGLDVRDRSYHLKSYKSCFIASEAVDFMVQNGIADTREDAVLFGRRLDRELGFWRHVCDSHEFKDEYLFFRFSSNEEQKIEPTKKDRRSSATRFPCLPSPCPRRDEQPRLPRRGSLSTERTDSLLSTSELPDL